MGLNDFSIALSRPLIDASFQRAVIKATDQNLLISESKLFNELCTIVNSALQKECMDSAFIQKLNTLVKAITGAIENILSSVENLRKMLNAEERVTLNQIRKILTDTIPSQILDKYDISAKDLPKLVDAAIRESLNSLRKLQAVRNDSKEFSISIVNSFESNQSLSNATRRNAQKLLFSSSNTDDLRRKIDEFVSQNAPNDSQNLHKTFSSYISALVSSCLAELRLEYQIEIDIDIEELRVLHNLDQIINLLVVLDDTMRSFNTIPNTTIREMTNRLIELKRQAFALMNTNIDTKLQNNRLTEVIAEIQKFNQTNYLVTENRIKIFSKEVQVQGGLVFLKENDVLNKVLIYLLPGFDNDTFVMKKLADELVAKGNGQVVCFLSNISGQVGTDSQFIISHMSEMVIRMSYQLKEEYSPKKIIVIGFSTGAMAALLALLGYYTGQDYRELKPRLLHYQQLKKKKLELNPAYDPILENNAMAEETESFFYNSIGYLQAEKLILIGCPLSLPEAIERGFHLPIKWFARKEHEFRQQRKQDKSGIPLYKNLAPNMWDDVRYDQFLSLLTHLAEDTNPFDHMDALKLCVFFNKNIRVAGPHARLIEKIKNAEQVPKLFMYGQKDIYRRGLSKEDLVRRAQILGNSKLAEYEGLNHFLQDNNLKKKGFVAASKKKISEDIYSFVMA
ncbi:MAG: hypothetical protein V1859_01035 [archaeon]